MFKAFLHSTNPNFTEKQINFTMRRWLALLNSLIKKKNILSSKGTRKIICHLMGDREEHIAFPREDTTPDAQLRFSTKEEPQKHGVKNITQSRYAVSNVSKSQK